MNKIYKDKKLEEGRDLLNKWMSENGGDVFETAYERLGKYVLDKDEFAKIRTKDDGIKAMKNKFLDFVTSSSKDEMFMSVVGSLDAIGRNGSHDYNINKGKAAAYGYDYLKANTLDMVELSSKQQYEAMAMQAEQQMIQAANSKNAQRELEESLAQRQREITKGVSETASTAMKHMPKINLSGGSGLGMAMLGTAAGLMISGYASGNPLRDKQASEVAQQQQPQQTMSVPQFMDQGGMVTGNSQGGYIINLQADTKKGRKYMKKMMAQAAEASVGGAVSVNMNLRDVSQNGITDRDIENYMNRYL